MNEAPVKSLRILVTGATGFIGRHLIHLLRSLNHEVAASSTPGDPLAKALPEEVIFLPCDIRDFDAIYRIMIEVKPHLIFHLAGLARSDDLEKLLSINVMGTSVLLRAAAHLPSPPKVVIPGSASEYGLQDGNQPINEQAPLRPLSAYGISKAAQTLLGQSYALRQLVPVVIGRIFNITGPGEPSTMLCGSLASQIVAAEKGERPPTIQIGNLSSIRDFLDIRDAVRALWLLALHGQSGQVYNICSGHGRLVKEVVYDLLALSSVSLALEYDPARSRAADISYCVGDATQLHRTTGWKPMIPFPNSLRDTLDWWRRAYPCNIITPVSFREQNSKGDRETAESLFH
ncbi:MAG: GDP-mannose 4,6-dehydratase [Anaerolineae bacterium]|nr:GDP-mannose 4,6-dehydratase [Anaerolineae bacterium]MDW8099045.1 GDP-mannose 4,6-dehydratase [Anaerolineae bacterium]